VAKTQDGSCTFHADPLCARAERPAGDGFDGGLGNERLAAARPGMTFQEGIGIGRCLW